MDKDSLRAANITILRFALYGAVFFGAQQALLFGAPVGDAEAMFGEDGRLELTQLAFLAAGLALMILVAWRFPGARPLAILLAGLLTAAVVREHNNHLKRIDIYNLWQMLVGGVMALAVAAAWPSRKRLISAVVHFSRSPALPLCLASALALAFGQALDEKALWQPVLGEDVPFLARRVGEELVELLAYGLLLLALIEWALAVRRTKAPDPVPA